MQATWTSIGHSRSKIFTYLQTVFDIGQRWFNEQKGIEYQSLMQKITKFNMTGRDRDRFRILVYCSSLPKTQSEFRLRNKWVQWLDFAAEDSWLFEDGQSLKQFIKSFGKSLSDSPPRPKPSSRGRPKKKKKKKKKSQ